MSVTQWRFIKTKGAPTLAKYMLQNVGNNQFINIVTKTNNYTSSYTISVSTAATTDICVSENGLGIFKMGSDDRCCKSSRAKAEGDNG